MSIPSKMGLAPNIHVEYVEAPDHRVLYIDGALIRGTESSDAILLDLFTGSHEIKDEYATLKADGTYESRLGSTKEGVTEYRRVIPISIVMTKANAKLVAQNIQQITKQIEEIQEKKA